MFRLQKHLSISYWSDYLMRFDRKSSKKERKQVEEQQVDKEEAPGKLEESVEAEAPEQVQETPAEAQLEAVEPAAEPVYEETKGKYSKDYVCTPTKKGYCKLRERSKAVYGIKYAAGKGVDMAKKAKTAIMDWCRILPKKSDPSRKQKEDLV